MISTTINGLIVKGRNALATDKASKKDVDRRAARLMVAMFVCAVVVAPQLAVAGPWDSMGTQVLGILTGGLTRTIAIITITACGIAALMGKLSWQWAINIVLGIVLIFGGAAIVDYLIAATA